MVKVNKISQYFTIQQAYLLTVKLFKKFHQKKIVEKLLLNGIKIWPNSIPLRNYLNNHHFQSISAKKEKQYQRSHATTQNRYDDVFQFVATFFKKTQTPNLLSFGCSYGDECFSVSKIIPNATILGVDVSENVINFAKKRNKSENIIFLADSYFLSSKKYPLFDCIFAMSVLCRYPDSKFLNKITPLYSFQTFTETIEALDKKLKEGGLLVIYNSNYCFEDTLLYKKYTPILESPNQFVNQFQPNGLCYSMRASKQVIFQKQKTKHS